VTLGAIFSCVGEAELWISQLYCYSKPWQQDEGRANQLTKTRTITSSLAVAIRVLGILIGINDARVRR
jgi:hypothetical protein